MSGGGIKSNTHYTANTGTNGANGEASSVYKSKEHIPSAVVRGAGSSKVLKDKGYEDAKNLNERFIDLNKGKEGAPKVSKPSFANQMFKASDYPHRLGD